MTRALTLVERICANLHAQTEKPAPDGLIATDRALNGLTIAVQELTAAHLYAEGNVTTSWPVLCEFLPAAFESADAGTDPVTDVILGAKPALQFMVMRVRKDRRLLTFGVEKLVVQIDQGTCRVEPDR
jgi:hypothetical protein